MNDRVVSLAEFPNVQRDFFVSYVNVKFFFFITDLRIFDCEMISFFTGTVYKVFFVKYWFGS